jgi:hypothetical protein
LQFQNIMKKKVIAIFKYCYRLIKRLEHEESVAPARRVTKKVMPKYNRYMFTVNQGSKSSKSDQKKVYAWKKVESE